MAKSISKRFCIAFAALVAALCLVLSFGYNGVLRAYAYEPYITGYDDTHDYTADDINSVTEYVVGEIRADYDALKSAGYDVDAGEGQLSAVLSEVDALKDAAVEQADKNALVEKLLCGNDGLNGVRTIANLAKTFYGYYVKDGGDIYAEKNYAPSIENEFRTAAENYLKEFKVENFANSYSRAAAQEYYDGFGATVAEYDAKQTEFNEYLEGKIAEINACYDKYHSEKYDENYVDSEVSPSKLGEYEDRIRASEDKKAADDAAEEYKALYSGMPTYVKVHKAELENKAETLRTQREDTD